MKKKLGWIKKKFEGKHFESQIRHDKLNFWNYFMYTYTTVGKAGKIR